MTALARVVQCIVMTALIVLAGNARAATFVYVSNADDGEIGTYRLEADGALKEGGRIAARKMVMPMAVSPDHRFLYAGIKAKPFSVLVYSIDPGTGQLRLVSVSPLAGNFPYISLDKTGSFLFGVSYVAHLITVNAVAADGHVIPDPLQVIPVGRNSHSIRTDQSNRFVYVAALGGDEIFQFLFDESSGRLTSNTPAVALMKSFTGPRFLITSPDNRYLFVLSELQGTVTTFALNRRTGLLREVSSASGLPPNSKLEPGTPRGLPPSGPPRNTDNDIWAADIHITPNGDFLYISERTTSTLATFKVEAKTGKLAHIESTPTEKQPRGFAIDPEGKFLIVAGEKSDTISVYSIDQTSGAIRLVGKYPAGRGGNWVEVVHFD